MSRTALCQSDQSQLLIIDIQEKLANVMSDKVLEGVLDNCKILLNAARDLSVPVVHTEQYPQGLGPTHPELAPLLSELPQAIEKTCFSGCGADGIEPFVNDHSRSQWVLLGMETHICVTQTCMELLEKDKTVFVVQDGVCSRFKSNYLNGIARMRDAGAIITNTESVLFEWLRDASHPEFRSLSRLIR